MTFYPSKLGRLFLEPTVAIVSVTCISRRYGPLNQLNVLF